MNDINSFTSCCATSLPTLDYLDEQLINEDNSKCVFIHSDVSLALRLDNVQISQQMVDSLRNQLVSVGVSDIPYPVDIDKCSSQELHTITEPNFCRDSLVRHSNYVKGLLDYFDKQKEKASLDEDKKLFSKAVDIVRRSAKGVVETSS